MHALGDLSGVLSVASLAEGKALSLIDAGDENSLSMHLVVVRSSSGIWHRISVRA
jgi:hypothetical protein